MLSETVQAISRLLDRLTPEERGHVCWLLSEGEYDELKSEISALSYSQDAPIEVPHIVFLLGVPVTRRIRVYR